MSSLLKSLLVVVFAAVSGSSAWSAYPQNSSCGGVSPTATVTVDFALLDSSRKPERGIILGLGQAPNDPPSSMILPLKFNNWRVGGAEAIQLKARVDNLGAKYQLVLSDLWGYPQPGQPYLAPYHNWGLWEEFVRQVATHFQGQSIMVDIWNEPDVSQFWVGTGEQYLEMFYRAAKILRSVGGSGFKIGGPSVSNLGATGVLLTQGLLDMCLARGCEVNYMSFHAFMDDISLIKVGLDYARSQWVDNPKYDAIHLNEVHVNEYLGQFNQIRPGAILAALYYLEKGKANGANKSCWDTNPPTSPYCTDGHLAHLLDFTTKQPRSGWWAYKFYADSLASRVKSSSTLSRISAFGSRKSDSASSPQVVFGRYVPPGVTAPTYDHVNVVFRNLPQVSSLVGASEITVQVQAMPDRAKQVVTSPTVVKTAILSLSSQNTLCVPNVPNHSAYKIKIIRR